MESQGDGTTIVRAQVPQGEVLRYASDLRSIAGGRGWFPLPTPITIRFPVT